MILVGLARLGADAELRYTPSNEAVCNLRLAFNYGKKGDDGKRPTQWVEASLWGKRAESLAQYLTKGTAVDVVLSEPHIETYQGKNGEGVKLSARVMDIELAGGGERKEGAAPERKPEPKPAGGGGNGGSFADFEDSIPF